MHKALSKGATDIHLKCTDKLVIRLRVMGRLEDVTDLEADKGEKLMNYLKYRSMINVNYKMTPQTGAFHYTSGDHTWFLRISYLPGLDFKSIVIRILNNHDPITLDDLSPLTEFTAFLEDICARTSGLFLVSGATGSGKSTTLYAMLDALIAQGGRNIVTLEDPIEMVKEHCLQIEMNESLGISYQSSLKQILRHDPDIIMIGEIRDEKTAQLAITCSLTGHLVLSTIHASTAALVMKRLLNLGVNATDIEDVLIGVASQKIKYDRENGKVIILPEILTRQDILSYIRHQPYEYQTFHISARHLVAEGCPEYLLRDELDGCE